MYGVSAAFLRINRLCERALLSTVPGGPAAGAFVPVRVVTTVASPGALPVETDGAPVWVGELAIVGFGASRCITIPQGCSPAFTDLVGVSSQADGAGGEGASPRSLPRRPGALPLDPWRGGRAGSPMHPASVA